MLIFFLEPIPKTIFSGIIFNILLLYLAIIVGLLELFLMRFISFFVCKNSFRYFSCLILTNKSIDWLFNIALLKITMSCTFSIFQKYLLANESIDNLLL